MCYQLQLGIWTIVHRDPLLYLGCFLDLTRCRPLSRYSNDEFQSCHLTSHNWQWCTVHPLKHEEKTLDIDVGLQITVIPTKFCLFAIKKRKRTDNICCHNTGSLQHICQLRKIKTTSQIASMYNYYFSFKVIKIWSLSLILIITGLKLQSS